MAHLWHCAECPAPALKVPGGKTVIRDEASVGLLQVFLEAGYEVVASPTLRRRVVRRRLAKVY